MPLEDLYDRIIVMDMGSFQFRSGYAVDSEPRSVRYTSTGRPYNLPTSRLNIAAEFIGVNATSSTGDARLIDRGVVVDWDRMKSFWSTIIEEDLRWKPENTCLMVCDSLWDSELGREKAMEIGFESLNLKGFYAAYQPIAGLLSTGVSSGMVIDGGYDFVTVAPIMDSYVLQRGARRSAIAGHEMDLCLRQALAQRPENRAALELATDEHMREIKENHCYIPFEYSREERIFDDKDLIIEIDRGLSVHVGKERYRAAEPLFSPYMIKSKEESLTVLIRKSMISATLYHPHNAYQDGWFEGKFYSNIVITGGLSKLDGFVARIRKETSVLAPSRAKVHVQTPAQRDQGTWVGASLWARQPGFTDLWITKACYDEYGSEAIHFRCLR
ncbi:hypothetical protein ACOME3_007959 [Neoechinorhynchus agilis]